MAVELTLQIKCKEKFNTHVRIMSDNTTAVAAIKKQGSLHSKVCNEIGQRIWKFMLHKGNWMSAAHCPGVDNVEADRASREYKDDVEWSLKQEVFDQICNRLKLMPDIDLFASRLNKKVTRYSAWQPDPGAEYIDAFTGFWGKEGETIYVFPPFAILPRVLQKFRQDGAEGLVIVPFWVTKPWFTLWGSMLIDTPIVMEVTDDLLFLPYRDGSKSHPLKGQMRLLAGILSGDHSKQRDFRHKLLKPWFRPEDNRRTNYTSVIGKNGQDFVIKGKLIPLEVL